MMTRLKQVLFGLTTLALLLAWSGCAPKVDKTKIPISTNSKKARELYLKGRDMQERLLFAESKTVFEEAVAADPDFALSYLGLALAQSSNKEFFKYFNRAKDLAEKATQGEQLLILATDACNNGDPQLQGQYLRHLVSLFPEDPRAHNQLGNFYFTQQKYAEATQQLFKATELDSSFSSPYNMLGYANRAIGNYAEAEKAFKKYIQLIPDDPNPYDSYAELLLKMGRFEESIGQYRKALEIQPSFVFSHIGIASDLIFMDKPVEARNELGELLKVASNDGQRRAAFFAMAVSYVHEDNFESALSAINESFELARKIEDHGGMAQDLTNMGSLNLEAGNFDEALTKYEGSRGTIQASDLSKEIKDNAARTLLYNRARIAVKKGDFSAAKELSNQFSSAVMALGNPNQIRLSFELKGMIALEEKDFETAIQALELGNKQNAYTLYRLALAYQGRGDNQIARTYCEKAANFNGLNDLNYSFIRAKAMAMLNEIPTA